MPSHSTHIPGGRRGRDRDDMSRGVLGKPLGLLPMLSMIKRTGITEIRHFRQTRTMVKLISSHMQGATQDPFNSCTQAYEDFPFGPNNQSKMELPKTQAVQNTSSNLHSRYNVLKKIYILVFLKLLSAILAAG